MSEKFQLPFSRTSSSVSCSLLLAVLAYPLMGAAEHRARSETLSLPDVVQLRDGTTLQGRIIEIRPTNTLTIVMADGSPRVIALRDIVTARGPEFTIPEQPVAPAASRVPPAATTPVEPTASNDLRDPGPGRVPVIVESAGAQVTVGEAFGFVPRSGVVGRDLCLSPCTLYVRPGLFSLRTTGAPVPPTTQLDVPPTGLRVTVRPVRHPGAQVMYVMGSLLSVYAAAGTALWGVVWIADPYAGANAPPWGAALLAASIAAFAADVTGFVLTARYWGAKNRPIVQPLDQPAASVGLRLGVAVAPVPNGAVAEAALRF